MVAVGKHGGGIPRGGVEFQPAVALLSRVDAGERVSQALDIADGGVRGWGGFWDERGGMLCRGSRKVGLASKSTFH